MGSASYPNQYTNRLCCGLTVVTRQVELGFEYLVPVYVKVELVRHSPLQSPDGKMLACGAIDGMINVFDTTAGKLLHTLQGHAMPVRSVSITHILFFIRLIHYNGEAPGLASGIFPNSYGLAWSITSGSVSTLHRMTRLSFFFELGLKGRSPTRNGIPPYKDRQLPNSKSNKPSPSDLTNTHTLRWTAHNYITSCLPF